MFNILEWSFNWCQQEGVIKTLRMLKTIINILRIAVPIGLIVWSMIDVFGNIANPDNKDIKKKISDRIIAAIVVFLVPVLVDLVIDVAVAGDSNVSQDRDSFQDCWNNIQG